MLIVDIICWLLAMYVDCSHCMLIVDIVCWLLAVYVVNYQ